MNKQGISRSQVGAAEEIAPVNEVQPAKCCCSRPEGLEDQIQAMNTESVEPSMEVSA